MESCDPSPSFFSSGIQVVTFLAMLREIKALVLIVCGESQSDCLVYNEEEYQCTGCG
jgi:hypothetical protein